MRVLGSRRTSTRRHHAPNARHKHRTSRVFPPDTPYCPCPWRAPQGGGGSCACRSRPPIKQEPVRARKEGGEGVPGGRRGRQSNVLGAAGSVRSLLPRPPRLGSQKHARCPEPPSGNFTRAPTLAMRVRCLSERCARSCSCHTRTQRWSSAPPWPQAARAMPLKTATMRPAQAQPHISLICAPSTRLSRCNGSTTASGRWSASQPQKETTRSRPGGPQKNVHHAAFLLGSILQPLSAFPQAPFDVPPCIQRPIPPSPQTKTGKMRVQQIQCPCAIAGVRVFISKHSSVAEWNTVLFRTPLLPSLHSMARCDMRRASQSLQNTTVAPGQQRAPLP